MTATRHHPAGTAASLSGGAPARRAVRRWAWRLFRREWRQQLLVTALIVVAVAATVIGATVATNTPTPARTGFGRADDLASFSGSAPGLPSQIAALHRQFGAVDVIENQTIAIPGSVETFQLRAQNPNGPFGRPMLALRHGRYPTDGTQVAVTPGVASAFNLNIGSSWTEGGTTRRVVGIVDNPENTVDQFALVVPGQVTTPSQVTALFDAPGVAPDHIGPTVQAAHSAASGNVLNPQTISIAAMILGMLLVALVAVAGFTVLAQRRLRALGMLAALGGTEKQVRTVVRANGLIVGVAGAVVGAGLGLAGWLAYRPHVEASAHHTVAPFALPWPVVGLTMVLAVATSYLAASRPARAISQVPVLAALSGRPAPPRRVHRSAVPGIVLLVASFFLLGYSGSQSGNGGGMPELALGLILLIPGVILLAPFCLSALARLGRNAPLAIRLALRDLDRYRARSGSALAAISIGVLVAVIVALLAAARYGNSLDYAGPNLAANQLVVYSPSGGPKEPSSPSPAQVAAMGRTVQQMAASLASHDVVELDTTSATLWHAAPGRNWNGAIYVATPQLLAAFGITAGQIPATADILSMRPGLAGTSKMWLTYGENATSGPPPGTGATSAASCSPGSCLADPVIRSVDALPGGTSAPNTVITEQAVHALGLVPVVAGWLIQTPQPLTAAQIKGAQLAAAAAGLTVESRNDIPTMAQVINTATVFGVGLALAILFMSVGLIRAETASDLRILSATGASAVIRRSIIAATAGALALLGALLGTVAGYLAVIGWIRTSALNGGIGALGNVPVANLLAILVGMPLVAIAAEWLVAGRRQSGISRQPVE